MKGLEKFYDKLNPRERVALINAAWARGDEAEAVRLGDTAPRLLYKVAEHVWYGTALRQVEMCYLVTQLDHCATLWRWRALVAGTEREERSRPTLQALCYRMVQAADGWALFCEGIGIIAPGTISELREYGTLAETLDLARLLAFTQVEMVDWLEANGSNAGAITPEESAAQWRQALEALA